MNYNKIQKKDNSNYHVIFINLRMLLMFYIFFYIIILKSHCFSSTLMHELAYENNTLFKYLNENCYVLKCSKRKQGKIGKHWVS